MHVIDRISAQEIDFNEPYKMYSNNFNISINECISEVNKHSLKQLLLAFLREDLLSYHYQNTTLIFDLQRSNYFMYVTRVKLFTLLRFTHFDSLILKHKPTSLKQIITDPLKLLDIVKNELENILNMDQWLNLYKEIANHLQNALFSTWKKYNLNKLVDRRGGNSQLQLNNLLKFSQITINGSLQFEQSVFSGHPCYPWQIYYFTFISSLFKEYIENKIIVIFDKVKVIASPTLSFRTLLLIENINSPYIKLPVAVQATSIVRILSLIENITKYLAANEVAIVVASFFEKSSMRGTNLFIEIMQLSGCLSYQEALDYFSHYADLMLGSYLDLFLLYGLTLEGHQQNTLAILREGKIKRFIARDFDNMRIHAESLKTIGIDLNLTEESPYLQKNKETVRNLFLYTVYQLYLGKIVLPLANFFNCEERPFWKIVREVTERRFYALKSRMCPITWKIKFNTILNAHWPVKALFRMRLEKNYLRDGLFSQIVNPLSL